MVLVKIGTIIIEKSSIKASKLESAWRTAGFIAHIEKQTHRKYSAYWSLTLVVHTGTLVGLVTIDDWLLEDTLECKQLYKHCRVV